MIRRRFLGLLGLGVAASSLSGVGFATTTVRESATGIILNELSYLKIQKEEVEVFVEEFLKRLSKETSMYNEIKFRALYFLNIKSKDSDLVDYMVSTFLLSTDFFKNGMDESKNVHYLGYYNRYKSPCSNPFSAIYYPS